MFDKNNENYSEHRWSLGVFWEQYLFEKLIVAQLVNRFHAFRETRQLLPRLQELAAGLFILMN